MPVVTLSREYGSGGLSVGRRVAELIGADFVDHELIDEVARRLEVTRDAVHRWDERREGIVLRLLRALRAAHPEYVPGAALPELVTAGGDPEAIGRMTREVIEDEARTGRAVFVGRGAAFILPAGPEVHHFRIVAPRAWRIERLVATGTTEEEAGRLVDRIDRERLDYLRHHFGVDARDPVHYSLVLNTAHLGIEAAARMIAQVVRQQIASPDAPDG